MKQLFNQSSARPGREFSLTGLLSLVALAALLVCAGCGKASSVPAAGGGDPNEMAEVTQFRKAFELADTKTKFSVEEMIHMVKGRTYADALSNLQTFGSNPQLTADQKQSLQNLITKVQAEMASK